MNIALSPCWVIAVLLLSFHSSAVSADRYEELDKNLNQEFGEKISFEAGYELRWAGDTYVAIKRDAVTDLNSYDNFEDLVEIIRKSGWKTNLVIRQFAVERLNDQVLNAAKQMTDSGIKVTLAIRDGSLVLRIGEDHVFLDKVEKAVTKLP